MTEVRFLAGCWHAGLSDQWLQVLSPPSCSDSMDPQGAPHSESGAQGWRDSAGRGFGAWTELQMSC